MQKIYSIFRLQEKFRIDPKRISDLAMHYNAKLDGSYISLEDKDARKFIGFLELSLRANRLCQEANNLDANKLHYDALLKYEGARIIAEELGDHPLKITCLNNIGLIFESLEDFPKALTNFREAVKLAEKVGDQLGKALQLGNIVRIYKSEKKYSVALRIFRESLDILSSIKLKKSLYYVKEEVESYIAEIKKLILKFRT